MDPFFGIGLSFLAIRSYTKRLKRQREGRPPKNPIASDSPIDFRLLEEPPYPTKREKVVREKPVKTEEEIAREKAEKQRETEIRDLKKQGYTDELIAVIIPTINNGQ